ncbi:MAG: hypothetical protein E6Q83_03470 [Thiothrix sp.]|nr:MAG: hypothetical protein E6Q83_03470 [Thiothrix sp.]
MQQTYGYINTKTNVLWAGQTPMLDMLSDTSHPDNRGRLETFVNDQEHGRLDWERISDESRWKELVAIYGEAQGITLEDRPAPVKEAITVTKFPRKSKAAKAASVKKPKKTVTRAKPLTEPASSGNEQPG